MHAISLHTFDQSGNVRHLRLGYGFNQPGVRSQSPDYFLRPVSLGADLAPRQVNFNFIARRRKNCA